MHNNVGNISRVHVLMRCCVQSASVGDLSRSTLLYPRSLVGVQEAFNERRALVHKSRSHSYAVCITLLAPNLPWT